MLKMLAPGLVATALVLLALLLPQRAWALRCGTHIVGEGATTTEVRDHCGAPFFVDRYVGGPGMGVDTPVQTLVPAVTREVWYYNFGPQRLMVRLDFSGGVLAHEETLGYGFVGSGGPCDFTGIVPGMSVAELIARCGYPARRSRNPLATAAGLGDAAPAWAEVWFYPGNGSNNAREVHLQDGRVVDVRGRP